ncbi:TIGR02266 family protein [Corallococcus carmarthensis]|uniref:TIGR02266 family protein n=1 Tax=Corallococcus carmarthensis TaxID=2316728 RepID=UPI001FC930B8|nr:TIGR02266 family protein [Corallococcus carmarthensis]
MTGPAPKLLPLRIRLPYTAEEEFIERYGSNVGRGGVFVATRALKPEGTGLAFEFVLADGTRLLRGEGVVLKAQPDAGSARTGMTVRFTKLDAASKALIDRIVTRRGGTEAVVASPAAPRTEAAPLPPGLVRRIPAVNPSRPVARAVTEAVPAPVSPAPPPKASMTLPAVQLPVVAVAPPDLAEPDEPVSLFPEHAAEEEEELAPLPEVGFSQRARRRPADAELQRSTQEMFTVRPAAAVASSESAGEAGTHSAPDEGRAGTVGDAENVSADPAAGSDGGDASTPVSFTPASVEAFDPNAVLGAPPAPEHSEWVSASGTEETGGLASAGASGETEPARVEATAVADEARADTDQSFDFDVDLSMEPEAEPASAASDSSSAPEFDASGSATAPALPPEESSSRAVEDSEERVGTEAPFHPAEHFPAAPDAVAMEGAPEEALPSPETFSAAPDSEAVGDSLPDTSASDVEAGAPEEPLPAPEPGVTPSQREAERLRAWGIDPDSLPRQFSAASEDVDPFSAALEQAVEATASTVGEAAPTSPADEPGQESNTEPVLDEPVVTTSFDEHAVDWSHATGPDSAPPQEEEDSSTVVMAELPTEDAWTALVGSAAPPPANDSTAAEAEKPFAADAAFAGDAPLEYEPASVQETEHEAVLTAEPPTPSTTADESEALSTNATASSFVASREETPYAAPEAPPPGTSEEASSPPVSTPAAPDAATALASDTKPSAPAAPDSSAALASDPKLSVPAAPDTSTALASDAKPSVPAAPDASTALASDTKPSAPAAPDTSAALASDTKPSGPAAPDASTALASDTKPSVPAAPDSSAALASDTKPSAPAAPDSSTALAPDTKPTAPAAPDSSTALAPDTKPSGPAAPDASAARASDTKPTALAAPDASAALASDAKPTALAPPDASAALAPDAKPSVPTAPDASVALASDTKPSASATPDASAALASDTKPTAPAAPDASAARASDTKPTASATPDSSAALASDAKPTAPAVPDSSAALAVDTKPTVEEAPAVTRRSDEAAQPAAAQAPRAHEATAPDSTASAQPSSQASAATPSPRADDAAPPVSIIAPPPSADAQTSTAAARSRRRTLFDLAPAVPVSAPAAAEIVLGIDVGTSQARVAAFIDGVATPIPIPGIDGSGLPSVIAVSSSGEIQVGAAALVEAARAPRRAAVGLKRLLGVRARSPNLRWLSPQLPFPIATDLHGDASVELGGRVIAPTLLTAMLLRELRQAATTFLNRKVTRAVLCAPSHFTERQRAALREAATMAGLEVPRVLTNSAAAALAYAHGRGLARKRVLVVDLGGGGLEVCVVQVTGDDLEVVTTGGDPTLGGMDFDGRIAEALVSDLSEQGHPRPEHPLDWGPLRTLAESTKEALSTKDSVDVVLPTGPGPTLDRERVEALTADLAQRVVSVTREVLESNALSPQGLDAVLLVGGQSRAPLVRRRLEESLGVPVRDDGVDARTAVVRGAALLGHALLLSETGKPAASVSEVLTAPIGVAEDAGTFRRVLERNTRLPTSKTLVIPLTVPGPLVLAFFQGTAPTVAENEWLGALSLTVERPGEVEVHLELSTDGTLAFSATLPGAKRQPVTLATEDLDDSARDVLLARSPFHTEPEARPGGLLSGLKKLFGRR